MHGNMGKVTDIELEMGKQRNKSAMKKMRVKMKG